MRLPTSDLTLILLSQLSENSLPTTSRYLVSQAYFQQKAYYIISVKISYSLGIFLLVIFHPPTQLPILLIESYTTWIWYIDPFVVVQSLSCVQLLWPHGLQHTRLPCPSPPPRVYLNSCPPGLPSSVSKESACNAGYLGPIPGSGRSSGEGNSNTLQYSCLENF